MKPYYEKQQEEQIAAETTTDESKKTEQAPRATSESPQEMPVLTTVRESSRIHRAPARYNE